MIHKNNLENFIKIYDFKKKNYNILIHGSSGIGKFDFLLSILDYYYEIYSIPKKNNILLNPDILYISCPLYNSSNNIVGSLSNDERLLNEYKLINEIDGQKIGKSITIDQIRDVGVFASLSPSYNHKIIIINSCDFLNKESSAALLKTLEESKSQCIFFLLSSDISNIESTIVSRCHRYAFTMDNRNLDLSSFSSYFYSKIPMAYSVFKKYNIDLISDDTISELNFLFDTENQKFIHLSESWMNRGLIFLDYLIELFMFMIKSEFINENPVVSLRKKIYQDIGIDENSFQQSSLIKIVNVLLSKKNELSLNLNPKIFYDNLLIELKENI